MKKATRQHTKEHNRRLVLNTVFRHDAISRAEIARKTKLTRATVSEIVSSLLDMGLLAEIGVAASSGGRPPVLVGLVDDARQSICVDLSADEYYGAVVNLRGRILHRYELPGRPPKGEASLQGVYDLIDALLGLTTAPVLGIGVSSPGLVDTHEGIVRQAVNRGWVNLPLRKLLLDRYDLPIHIANDSHMIALAEYTFGHSARTENLVVVKVSEGIGSGIVLGGKLYCGDGFGAGEIGHLSVAENGTRCVCGNVGCLETLSSMRALVQRAQAIAQENPGSFLARRLAEGEEIDRRALVQAVQAGDEAVRSLVRAAARYLGAAIASLVGVLNIHEVILAGDLIDFGDFLLDEVRDEVRKRVLPRIAAETHISFSTLGGDATILGTSALVLAQELGLP